MKSLSSATEFKNHPTLSCSSNNSFPLMYCNYLCSRPRCRRAVGPASDPPPPSSPPAWAAAQAATKRRPQAAAAAARRRQNRRRMIAAR